MTFLGYKSVKNRQLNHFFDVQKSQESQGTKKFYNKFSENSRSKIVFRTDILPKIVFGCPCVKAFLSMICISNIFVEFLLRWHSQIWVWQMVSDSLRCMNFTSHECFAYGLCLVMLGKQVMTRTCVVRNSALSLQSQANFHCFSVYSICTLFNLI